MWIIKNLRENISQRDIDMNMTFFTDNLWFWLEDSNELNFQMGYDFIKKKELLTIEEKIKENKKIDYYRLREVSNVIFRNQNISLIVMGDAKGLTKQRLKEWLEIQTILRSLLTNKHKNNKLILIDIIKRNEEKSTWEYSLQRV